jgi:hypothetical protein
MQGMIGLSIAVAEQSHWTGNITRSPRGWVETLLVVWLVASAGCVADSASPPAEASREGQQPSGPKPAVVLQGPPSSAFGLDLSRGADFNHDGLIDIAVGAPGIDKVFLYSAKSDQPFVTVEGPPGSYFGGSVETAGDFNGDGVADLVVGAPEFKGSVLDAARGKVLVYAGPKLQSVLFEVAGEAQGDYFGVKVVGGFDFNRDGKSDILVVANHARPHGKIYVYAGGTGDLLFTTGGTRTNPLSKFAIDRTGDLNRDGFDDIIVGSAPDSGSGRAWVFRGPNGASLCEIAGLSSGDKFAEGVTGGGDVNGDGRPDIVIGARGAEGSGRVYVYNGADCALIVTMSPPAGDTAFGRAVEFVGDVNGDGSDELAVCSSVGGAFRVQIISGRSAAVLHTYDYRARTSFGARMAGMLDFTLDGVPDIAVGAQGAASVFLYPNKLQ